MTQKKQTNQNSKKKVSFDLTKFKFLYDFILVRAVKDEGIKGLVKPENYDDKPQFGEVISTGKGRLLDNGEIVPSDIKTGDIIFFSKYSSEQSRSLGKDYFIIRLDDVRAVL